MRKLLLLLLVTIFYSCKTKIKYYQGYIYSEDKMPQENLIICGRDHVDVKGKTDKNGFFKIEKRENWVESFLYIKKNKKKLDSIQIVRKHPEYGIELYFTEKRTDTVFLNLKR